MVSGILLLKGVNETGSIGALTGNPVGVTKCEMNDILVSAEAEIVFGGVVSNTETASEGPMAEDHGHIFPGESKQCPVFKEERPSRVRLYGDSCKRLKSLQAAKTQVSPSSWSGSLSFEPHCVWSILKMDGSEFQAVEMTMQEFCNKVSHVAFASKPGFYIPTICLVGDDILPINVEDVI